MNRTEKRLFERTMQLGVGLTLVVIACDYLGLLQPLERYIYDLRARHFQYFTPPPTDKIVMLDIDDQSLQEIGWWPWPRTKLAIILDEIRLAGAKVVGFDVIFPEAQEPRYEPRLDGTFQQIDDDRNFAEAIRRAGNVLLPVTVNLSERGQQVDVQQAVAKVLESDLELSPDDVISQLRGTRLDSAELSNVVKQVFITARDRAAFKLVQIAMSQGEGDPDRISGRLAPRAFAAFERTDVRLLLEKTIPRVKSVQRSSDFMVPVPVDAPPTLATDDALGTIAILLEAAKYSGTVNFTKDPDGVARTVPLFINFGGKLIPHMALASACAYLGAPMSNVKITADAITIPVPNAEPIVIPVRTLNSATFGRVGLFMDLPYFGDHGNDSWLTMYDAPRYVEPKQHVPLRNIWTIQEYEHDLRKNRQLAIDAMAQVLAVMTGSEAKVREFLDSATSMTDADVERRIRDQMSDETLKSFLQVYREMPAKDLDEQGARFLKSCEALQSVLEGNPRRRERQQAARDELRQKLEGKYCLISWTATGRTDFYATSLDPNCPGGVIQTVVFNAVMTRHFWTASSWWVGAMFAMILGVVTSWLVARLHTVPALMGTVTLTAGYGLLNGLVFFDYGNRIVGAAAPIAVAVVISFAVTAARYLYEQAERSRITRRFSRMVDPALVNYFIENPDALFDGQVKEMTVVFTDLAGFTTISEKLRERTVPLLNEYMSIMLPLIRRNKGYWNKFLGDGIMFFYNAPLDNHEHARDAVKTVLEMQASMEQFNQRLFTRGLPQVAMRAGIASGMMVVGDAGSTDAKDPASDYTVLGDEVNLGARLESANKAFGSRILMNGRTAELLDDTVLIRPMGVLQVVGKTHGVSCYEALCMTSDATEKQKSLAEMSKQVVDRYRAADFQACVDAARRMEETHGSSKFTQLYVRLSKEYLISPPEHFDGHIVLEAK